MAILEPQEISSILSKELPELTKLSGLRPSISIVGKNKITREQFIEAVQDIKERGVIQDAREHLLEGNTGPARKSITYSLFSSDGTELPYEFQVDYRADLKIYCGLLRKHINQTEQNPEKGLALYFK